MQTPGDTPVPEAQAPANEAAFIAAALNMAERHPEARLQAARLEFARGRVDTALEELERVIAESPTGREQATEIGLSYRLAMGRFHEAFGDSRVDGHRRAPSLLARLANIALGVGNGTTGLALVRRARSIEPRSAVLQMAEADGLLEVGAWHEAMLAARAAIDRARGDRRYIEAAASLCLHAGEFEDAHHLAQRALALVPTSSTAHDIEGHLALFRGEAEGALGSATALDQAGAHAAAATLRGGALCLRGDARGALAELETAIRLDDGSWEAYGWRAELRCRAGDRDGAAADADRALARGQGQRVSVRIVRVLAMMAGNDGVCQPGERADLDEIAGAVTTIHPEAATDLEAGDRRAIVRWLEAALVAMKGNRWICPSYFKDGQIVAVRFRGGPRHLSRRVLDCVTTAPADELLEELVAIERLHPQSGLPLCHRGELLLWLGRWDEARAALERVVRDHPRTRWAYVGLAQIAMHDGRPNVALATIARGIEQMGGTTTPTVIGTRGEAFLRQGQFKEAIADLEVGLAAAPARLTAWISLALAQGALGRSEEMGKAAASVRHLAWPLLHDVARPLGLDPDALPSSQILEAALEATLGCRSAVRTTWRVGGSPLRGVDAHPRTAEVIATLRRTERATALRELQRVGALPRAPAPSLV